MWTMKLNLVRQYRGFKDTGIAFNNQLLLQNNNAGLDPASAAQLHLDGWQGEGMNPGPLTAFHPAMEASNRKCQAIFNSSNHIVSLTLEKLP